MKQAILITAYKNYNHLEDIISFFDNDFEIYIHIDKKSVVSGRILNKLKSFSTVKLVSQRFKVNWGGFNHLKSILYLIEEGLKNESVCYFHLISGHDFPIKKLDDFKDFFNKNKEQEFIDCFSVPRVGWANNGGMDRIEYYNLYDILNAKNSRQYSLIKGFRSFQKKIGYKRSFSSKMPKLYAGSTWWSLSRECIEYVIYVTKKDKYLLNRFKYTLCSEEFYFQTIIMNSVFANRVNKSNLRYIDWTLRNGNSPAVLDCSDYEKLLETKAFFARKFDYPISKDIMRDIKRLVS